MAEILKSRGYQTGGFTCNPWLHTSFGTAQGFDTYEEVYKLANTEPDKGAAKATEMAVKWINHATNDRKPFFLFVNYIEAHLPYEPPARILNRLGLMKAHPETRSFQIEHAEW